MIFPPSIFSYISNQKISMSQMPQCKSTNFLLFSRCIEYIWGKKKYDVSNILPDSNREWYLNLYFSCQFMLMSVFAVSTLSVKIHSFYPLSIFIVDTVVMLYEYWSNKEELFKEKLASHPSVDNGDIGNFLYINDPVPIHNINIILVTSPVIAPWKNEIF